MFARFLWPLAGLLLSAGMSVADEIPTITVPLRSALPQIDGVIDEGEWRESVTLAGFLTTKPMGLVAETGGEGTVSFATDGQELFLAFRFAARNNDPGGGLAARADMRDGDVPSDDNIELLIKTPQDAHQVYHLMVNPRDVVFDRLWPVGRAADKAWNCPGLRVKSVVKARVWECEMAIPLASIGSPKEAVLINVVRNSPNGGTARLIPTSDYQSGTKLAVRWAKDAPAIHMLPLGRPLDGNWSTGIRIASAPAGQRYSVGLTMNTKYKPEVEGLCVAEKDGLLAAGESLRLDYSSFSRNYLCYAVTVRDETGAVLFARSFLGKRGRQAKTVPMTGEYDLGDWATAVAYYYP